MNPAVNAAIAGFAENGRIPDLPEPEPKSGTSLSQTDRQTYSSQYFATSPAGEVIIILETVSIAEPLQNRQHAPPMLATLGSKEKREGG